MSRAGRRNSGEGGVMSALGYDIPWPSFVRPCSSHHHQGRYQGTDLPPSWAAPAVAGPPAVSPGEWLDRGLRSEARASSSEPLDAELASFPYSVRPRPAAFHSDADAGRQADRATPGGGYCVRPPPAVFRTYGEAVRSADQAAPGGYCVRPPPVGFCTDAEAGRLSDQATSSGGYFARPPPLSDQAASIGAYCAGPPPVALCTADCEAGRQADQATPDGGYCVRSPPVFLCIGAKAGRQADQATPGGGYYVRPPPLVSYDDGEAGSRAEQTTTPRGGYCVRPPPAAFYTDGEAQSQADQATPDCGYRVRPPPAVSCTDGDAGRQAEQATPGGWIPQSPLELLPRAGCLHGEEGPSGAVCTAEGLSGGDAGRMAEAIAATQRDILNSCGFLRVEEVQVRRRRRARRATYRCASSLTMFVSGLLEEERDRWLDSLLLRVKGSVERLTSHSCEIRGRKLYVSDAARDAVVHVDLLPYGAPSG